jgi:hypothetical protein
MIILFSAIGSLSPSAVPSEVAKREADHAWLESAVTPLHAGRDVIKIGVETVKLLNIEAQRKQAEFDDPSFEARRMEVAGRVAQVRFDYILY